MFSNIKEENEIKDFFSQNKPSVNPNKRIFTLILKIN